MARALVYLWSAAVVAAVLWPLAWTPPRDGFPLSSYPALSEQYRRTIGIAHVIGKANGKPVLVIPPEVVGGHDRRQAEVLVEAAVARGPEGAGELCGLVAGRVRQDRRLGHVTYLEVRRDTFDVGRYFYGETAPMATGLVAGCHVYPRPPRKTIARPPRPGKPARRLEPAPSAAEEP